MVSGVREGYITEFSEKTIEFPSVESAQLFISLCQGIDWWNALDTTQKNNVEVDHGLTIHGSYRCSYDPKIKRKSGKVVGCSVEIIDIGE